MLAHRHAIPQKLIVVHLRNRVPHSERDGTEMEEVRIWERLADGMEERVAGGGDGVELVECVWGGLAASGLSIGSSVRYVYKVRLEA